MPERGADLHMAQLMLLPLTVSCFSKIHIGFTFLVPADPGNPGKRAVKRVCACVRVCVCLCIYPQNGHRIVGTDSVTSLHTKRVCDQSINQSIKVFYSDKCKKLNSLKHLVRTTVAGSHN